MSVENVLSNMLSGVLYGGILALVALGLSIVLGVMRLVNLAHGEFLVGGAYIAFLLTSSLGIDPLILLPFVGLAAAAIAIPFQRILLAPLASKGEEASMMTTFGVSIVLQNAYLAMFSADTRSLGEPYVYQPLSLFGVSVPMIYVIGFAISVVVIVGVHLLVTQTAFGRDLRASARDPVAAATVGVNTARVHGLTFALGTACAALGGMLIGIMFSFTPSSGAPYLLTSFAIVVLGGMGNILGTLFGGVLIGVLQSIGALALGDGYRDLVGLVVFLAVLAVRRNGILSGAAR